jgi:3-oxoacyl-[acyl-carrier protein] reductase
MGQLDGKVAIITGSTSGMGQATAILFAKEGARVVVTGRSEERAREVVDTIISNGGKATYIIADTADHEAAKKIFDKTMESYGTVDILFNNVGTRTTAPVLEIQPSE